MRDAARGRRTSCPRPSGSPSCCARCRPSKCHLADRRRRVRRAPPGWSPSRTSSRSSSARSSTSTTSRSRSIERLPDGELPGHGADARRRGQRAARTPSCPNGDWDTVGGLVLHLLGHVPAEGEIVEVGRVAARRRAGAGPAHRAACGIGRVDGAEAPATTARPRSPRRCGDRPPTATRRSPTTDGRRRRRPMTGRGSSRSSGRPTSASPRWSTGSSARRSRSSRDKPQTDAHAGARRAQPARRAGGVRRHAGHPQARAPRSASGSTTPHRARSPTSTSCVPRRRRHRAASARATASSPPGCPDDAVVVVNKVDAATQARGARRSCAAAVGARHRRASTSRSRPAPGTGVDDLVDAPRRPPAGGSALLPRRHGHRRARGVLGGRARPRAAARVTHDELPHSIACRVTEWEWPRIRCEILVERDSQKGIVIGKGGLGAQGGRHRRPGAAAAGRLPRAVRQGRQGTGSADLRPSTASATDAASG